MYTEPRELFLTFHIDTNRINSRGGLQNMNKLERWRDEGLILVYMSKVAHEEATAGGDSTRTRKALGSIYSYTLANTGEEKARLSKIEGVLFPSRAQTQNERNDVEIAFNAGKYGAILVTADGDLLDRRKELGQVGIRVLTDEQAVALVERRIAERDERAMELSKLDGSPVPDWVGKDSLASGGTA